MFHIQFTSAARIYVLCVLFFLFIGRVFAQLLVSRFSIPFLPPFAAWHGDVLPYTVLLFFQFVLIILGAHTIYRIKYSSYPTRLGAIRTLRILAYPYLLFMTARLLLGLTLMSDHSWFGKPLPSFFHMVIASFIIISLDHFLIGQEDASTE